MMLLRKRITPATATFASHIRSSATVVPTCSSCLTHMFPIDLIWDEPTVAGYLRRLASFTG